jgi:hypothetical protein
MPLPLLLILPEFMVLLTEVLEMIQKYIFKLEKTLQLHSQQIVNPMLRVHMVFMNIAILLATMLLLDVLI